MPTMNTSLSTAFRTALVVMAAGGALLSAQQGQDHAGQYPQSDIAYGASLYAAQCTTCHGSNGDGVGGVNLKSGQIRRATTDRELTTLITNGIPGTAMPAFKSFTQAEQAGIVAYIRSMNSIDASSIKLGNAANGQRVFEGKGGCLKCHAVKNKGSVIAPDLSDIGSIRAPSQIERSLVDPSAQMMPINRPVRIVTNEGKTIEGRRLNEDTYTIQMMDSTGNLVSLEKSKIKERQIGTVSKMPSYRETLSAQELSDLMAYLLSLKGS
jgi:putative heme-binding domain-containing protein